MQKPTYCEYCAQQSRDNLHRIYHDTAYGFPIGDDQELFERLVLEINQAGLSWGTILQKQQNFKKAFHGFTIKKVARYGAEDRVRLLADVGIIRNRLKVDAAIHNAQVIVRLQKEYGSFQKWLEAHHPLNKAEWVKLFKKTFKFTGGEITGEFLMSIGYLPGAHTIDCPVYKKILKTKPAWVKV
jgi:DNA-3-methyladenine glycosylase I